jgi:zinc transporter ZupT
MTPSEPDHTRCCDHQQNSGAIPGPMAVGIAPALNARFMAFAAGAMLFVSMHELIPMARRYRHLGLFVGGVLVSALVYWLLARLTVAMPIAGAP